MPADCSSWYIHTIAHIRNCVEKRRFRGTEYECETEQEASDSDSQIQKSLSTRSPLESDSQTENEKTNKEYLEDLLLKYRRLGKFIGKRQSGKSASHHGVCQRDLIILF
ncbi:unnamed protein product [Parnassius apollo]|uniref:(apollo) hypothetical protein n=1 Tax=Parnassius apollo TaxID=110799 RepID=A0A8S3W3V6_PARAO|nr:unnamed protein product [Parnassius apollo]